MRIQLMLERTLFEGNCRRQQERKHMIYSCVIMRAHVSIQRSQETHLSARTSPSFSAQFIPLIAAVETFLHSFSNRTQQLLLWDGCSPPPPFFLYYPHKYLCLCENKPFSFFSFVTETLLLHVISSHRVGHIFHVGIDAVQFC